MIGIKSRAMKHKDLDVWKIGMEVVKEIFLLTAKFPKSEMYGLTSQMRRSAVSIPSNIAEGAGRNTKKEFLQFLYMSRGSLCELDTQLILTVELNFIQSIEINFERKLLELSNKLNALISSLQASQ